MIRPNSLTVETSALVAVILEEAGWRQIAEQIAHASAFTTCFNVFEAALAMVRERELSPSEAHEIVTGAADRLEVEIRGYDLEAIPLAIVAREKFGSGRRGLNMGDCLSMAQPGTAAHGCFTSVRTSREPTSTTTFEADPAPLVAP